MAGELADVRVRQENRLRRELERVDDYFENYERELAERAGRGGGSAKIKLANRLAVAKAEHARHRADQVARHEIAIVPYVDGLLLVAEPAWRMAFRWTARTSRRRASRRASCRVRDGGKSGLSTTRRCDRLCLAKSFRFVRERQRVQTFGECTRIHSMPLTLCFENGLDFRLSVPDRKR